MKKDGRQYDYFYYLCDYGRRRNGQCSNKKNYLAEPLEEAVFGTLLELAGHRKLRTKRLVAGRDYAEEMARVQEQIVHLEREILKARVKREDYSGLSDQKDAANAEMDRLINLEPEPACVEYQDTGLTFAQWWDTHGHAERNAFLRDQGVRVAVSPDPLAEDIVLVRPDRTFSLAVIERPGICAILHLGDLVRAAGELGRHDAACHRHDMKRGSVPCACNRNGPVGRPRARLSRPAYAFARGPLGGLALPGARRRAGG